MTTMKKPLPTLNQPTLVATLPVSQKKIKYRPFVVREQQALLLANESDDPDSIYATIEDILTTCTSNTVDVPNLYLADLAYLFLQLHISAVGPEIRLVSKCSAEDCGEKILLNVDLSTVSTSPAPDRTVNLTNDGVGIKFRFPTYSDTKVMAESGDRPIAGIFHLVEFIYDSESIYSKSDYTLDEFEEWVLSMGDSQMDSIYQFAKSLPDLVLDLNYTCPKCKKEHSKRVEGLHSFFRLSRGDELN